MHGWSALAAVCAVAALSLRAGPASAGEDEITWNAPERVPLSVFKKTFAGSEVKKYPSLRGIQNLFADVNEDHELARMTFIQTRLRGHLALIPVESSRILRLSNKLSAIAFPIYLCTLCVNDKVPPSLYADMSAHSAQRPRDAGAFGAKLFQVAFIDTVSNTFLAKPKDYPLESLRWDSTETGNWSRDLDLCIWPVASCRTCVEIRFNIATPEGPERDFLQIFSLMPSGAYTSARYGIGTQPPEAEKKVVVSYYDVRRQGKDVLARRETSVGSETTSEEVKLLELPDDTAREVGWGYRAE